MSKEVVTTMLTKMVQIPATFIMTKWIKMMEMDLVTTMRTNGLIMKLNIRLMMKKTTKTTKLMIIMKMFMTTTIMKRTMLIDEFKHDDNDDDEDNHQ
jgi:hypothetical protein